jgi:hypothetical protein
LFFFSPSSSVVLTILALQALLHETSTNFVVVAEFVDGISEAAAAAMESSLVEGFRDVFGFEVKTKKVLTVDEPEIELR